MWLIQKHPLGTDTVADRNTSPLMQGLVAAFVQHESINLGKGDLGPRLLCAWHVGQGRERGRSGLGMCWRPVTKHLLTFL